MVRHDGKMGKSLKNAVAPDDIYRDYGADTLRLYEMFMGPLDASRPWSTNDIVGVHKFLQRFWRNAVNEDTGELRVSDASAPDATPEPLRRVLHRTIDKVGRDMASLEYNTAIAALMELNNALTKVVQEQGSAPREVIHAMVLMLSPLTPHVAEELWAKLGEADVLAFVQFPVADPALLVDDTVEIPVQVNGKVRARISVAADATQDEIEAAARAEPRWPSCSRAPPCARSWWSPAAWSTSSSADVGSSGSAGPFPPPACAGTITAASRHFLLLIRRVADRRCAIQVAPHRWRLRRSIVPEPLAPSRRFAPAEPQTSPAPTSHPAPADGDPAFWDRKLDDPPRPPGERRLRFTTSDASSPLAERARALLGDTRAGVVALIVVAVIAGFVWYRMGAGGTAHGEAPATSPVASSNASTVATTRSSTGGASSAGTTATTVAGGRIVVHVAGAVTRPGVVELRAGDRVIDAIEAVGGALPDGDLDRLNLAAKLTDGQRVYVGRPGVADPGAAGGGDVAGASGGAATPGARLNLNTATQAQLEELPGVGPAFAQAILAERQRRGGFTSVNDLRSVRGIGDKRFADLSPLVTV